MWKPNIMEGYFRVRSAWPTIIYVTKRKKAVKKTTGKRTKKVATVAG